MALERQHFWGVTLSDKKREAKWSADNDDVEAEVDILNQLAVSQACLGSKATGTHVVEVTTKGINDNMITQPICVLQKGVIQQQLRLEFSSSATFKLAEGDGPVHLAGSHIQVLSSAFSDSDEDSEDEGIASHNQLPSGAKPQKTSISPAGKQPPTKKSKMDLLNDEESESEEESMPVLVPIKDKRKKPVPAKSDNQKKASKKDDKPKEKEGLLDNEAEEESEDEEEDDDFEMESDELEMGSDEDDDEDEDDEEDDDEDDEDEEEEDDEDEEKDSKVSKFKQKGTPSRAVNGQMAGKTPDKKTPNKKPQANTPKGKKPEAVQKTPKSDGPLDIDSIKQKLLKSPNLPKKVDKFKNFLRTNLKVTEDQTVNELWKWLQKNKK